MLLTVVLVTKHIKWLFFGVFLFTRYPKWQNSRTGNRCFFLFFFIYLFVDFIQVISQGRCIALEIRQEIAERLVYSCNNRNSF